MPRNNKRACSLQNLHRPTVAGRPLRFSLLERANLKALLHEDPARCLDGFQAAGVDCLMQWDYYARLKESDPVYAETVRRMAELRGIPEQLDCRPIRRAA